MAPKSNKSPPGVSGAEKPMGAAGKKAPPPTAISSTEEFEELLRLRDQNTSRYVLKLYVTGSTPRAVQAVSCVRSLCEEHLSGRYDLEVVDIYQQPGSAATDHIIAAPTLVKQLPLPAKRMVGNLSDKDKVLVSLDILPDADDGATNSTKWLKV